MIGCGEIVNDIGMWLIALVPWLIILSIVWIDYRKDPWRRK